MPDGLPHVPLRLKGTTTVENVRNSYDIQLDADDNTILDTILHQELGNEPAVDNSIVLNGITLQICEMVGRRIATVAILQTPPRAAADPLP